MINSGREWDWMYNLIKNKKEMAEDNKNEIKVNHPSWDGELSSKEEFLTTKRNIQMMLRRLTQTILTSKHTVEDMDYIFHVEQTLMDLMDEINLEALEGDMSYDEDHEDRDEEGTDFSESKKYSKVLKTLSDNCILTDDVLAQNKMLGDMVRDRDVEIETLIEEIKKLKKNGENPYTDYLT